MAFRTIPGTDTRYALLSFDADGQERADDPDGRQGKLSERLLDVATQENITNVFLFSHGWMGDIRAAREQYDRWILAFDSLAADRQRATELFPGFKPLYIGLHWPSLPWGDEEVAEASFSGEDDLFTSYLDRLGDKPAVREALATIIEESRRPARAEGLSQEARQAFLKLNDALELSSEGVGGAPDADREPFDPDLAFEEEDVSFGVASDIFSGVLGMLRLCSYWTMKKRARKVGEGGMHIFVNRLQHATAAGGTRIHLMGHSFGCIVISSILGGPECKGALERPIDSVVLAQGALSLWSYAPSIPFDDAGAGYFHPVIAGAKVGGPLVTTRSHYDLAVCDSYPKASLLARQISFAADDYPKYGSVGAFGFQGLPDDLHHDRTMLPVDGEYAFAKGKVYNLEASQFIAKGGPPSGAHNDIGGPEVAHALWQAAFASI